MVDDPITTAIAVAAAREPFTKQLFPAMSNAAPRSLMAGACTTDLDTSTKLETVFAAIGVARAVEISTGHADVLRQSVVPDVPVCFPDSSAQPDRAITDSEPRGVAHGSDPIDALASSRRTMTKHTILTLDPGQKAELRETITKAFNSQSLDMMCADYLGHPLDNIAAPASLDYMAHQVIGWAEDRGWLAKLVRGVTALRPDNPYVIRFERALGLHPVDAPKSAFEAMVGANRTFLDANSWLHQGHLMGTRVCQIRGGGQAGTGFLIGPDAVMTAAHVMAPAPMFKGGAAGYEFIFGYARSADGTEISAGETFKPADDWHIASAPTGDAETPTPDDLDFALVRLAQAVGRQNVDGAASGVARSWIDIMRDEYSWTRRGLAILQHPSGEPLKLALSATAVASFNSNHSRVRYTIPTEPGSSGSPVFDLETWRLVAVHHFGKTGQYNQAVPLAAIAKVPAVAKYLDEIG